MDAVLKESRVLFIHGIGEIGGAERELLTIASSLARRDYKPVVMCPSAGPFQHELATRGIETREGQFPAWRKVKGFFHRGEAVRSLQTVIAAERPSLIHVNDIWWVPQTLRACRGLSINIVAHVRQEIEPPKVQQYELDRVDLVIAVSHHIQRALEGGGVPKDRLRTIYSGLDIDRIPRHLDGAEVRRQLGLPAAAFVLGTVANLFPRKGYEVMLNAMPMVMAEVPEAHYLIIGTGDKAYGQGLKTLVKELDLEECVHFVGFQQSVYPVLAALDLYVHPALMEGFGIAVLEAMAMRKPVVATSTGGVPEIVQHGETGLLVPPGDPDALAQAVMSLLRDVPGCVALGQAARKRIEACFTVELMMSRLTSEYAGLLAERARAPQTVPS